MNEWVSMESLVKGPVKSGRICAIYGAPIDWVVEYPEFNPGTQTLTGDIVLGWEKYWLSFLAASTPRSFDEETKVLRGQTYWQQNLSFRLNWQSVKTDVKVQNMTYHRWIFLVKEAGTGLLYVVGKPPVGADLSVSYSDKQGTITDFKVTFQSLHRAPIYAGSRKASIRLIDADGDFIVDADGNYLASVGDMITPALPAGDFNSFSNSNF